MMALLTIPGLFGAGPSAAITLGITQSGDFSGSIGAESVIGGQAIDGGGSEFANFSDIDLIFDFYTPVSVTVFALESLQQEDSITTANPFCGNLPLLEIGIGCDYQDDQGNRTIFQLFKAAP